MYCYGHYASYQGVDVWVLADVTDGEAGWTLGGWVWKGHIMDADKYRLPRCP